MDEKPKDKNKNQRPDVRYVPVSQSLVAPVTHTKARDGTLFTPEGGVNNFVHQFGNRSKFIRTARLLGVRIHSEMVRKWITTDLMPDNIYNVLKDAVRDSTIVQGDTFIEVAYKGFMVGQFYLSPDVSLTVKKMRIK